ncbi:hypothetical protein [Patulibacter defluvii]|uniref:hypothetical protein n=1 Tax=Patulibacter defluvii TaxID=3095358 RepID=UPI002A763D0A|nr:hypothetical protein [Patulibacter sp. DM4]
MAGVGRRVPPWALALLLGALYVAVAPPTTDLAAQEHRVELARQGVWLYDLSWFGGHHLPSYSVLLPLLGALVGATVVGALAAVVAAWAFARLAAGWWPATEDPRPWRDPATVASWWFAAGIGGLLFTGRMTFVLGAALGLVALVLAADVRVSDRGREIGAAAAALLTALASPVAALFLALAGLAWWIGAPASRMVAATVTATAFGVALLLSVSFPGGGSEPFVASALWPALIALAATVLVLPARERALRAGAALYLAAIVLAGLLDTPMGGNATRLAALAGGPLLAAALLARERDGSTGRRGRAAGAVGALLLVAFLYWQWYPPVRDAAQAWGDRAARAGYWAPLADQLRERLRADPARVEIPPTARRGEARWIGPEIPLARGWIRQLDRDRNPLFYEGRPTADRYRRWLDENAVGWVAVPGAEPDHASRDELALLRDPAARRAIGLDEAWRNADWTLYRVTDPAPLVAAAADRESDDPLGFPGGGPDLRVAELRADRVVLRGSGGGTFVLRIRYSPYLQVMHGTACLSTAPGGWTHVRSMVHGTVTLGTGLPGPWRRAQPDDCDR